VNCYVMAAGNGVRLGPLTQETPKCLLPIGSKPMLRWWLDALFGCRCFEKIHVNLHYKADRVQRWIEMYCEDFSERGRRVEIIDEREKMLGTAGTLYWYGDNLEDFLVVYADTLSFKTFEQLPLFVEEWKMMRARRENREMLAGLLVFDAPGDRSCSILKTDRNGWVTSFAEKDGVGEDSWAGIMFGAREFYDELKPEDSDLATDVLPRMVKRMKVMGHVDAYDIGRGVAQYERAKEKFSPLKA